MVERVIYPRFGHLRSILLFFSSASVLTLKRYRALGTGLRMMKLNLLLFVGIPIPHYGASREAGTEGESLFQNEIRVSSLSTPPCPPSLFRNTTRTRETHRATRVSPRPSVLYHPENLTCFSREGNQGLPYSLDSSREMIRTKFRGGPTQFTSDLRSFCLPRAQFS